MEEKTVTFDEFGLSPDVLKSIADMGFEEATPIQEMTIKMLLEGKDVIGQAQTGTGKTAAFGIPIVEMVDTESKKVQSIILAPTRELAVQAAEEMNKLGEHSGVHAFPIYGGTSIERQITALERGVHVVVGTPGRILDHLGRGTLSLKNVKMLVLDEADEMLDMGFIDDIRKIIKTIPQSRQTLLFSATMPRAIVDISKSYMHEPVKIQVKSETLTAPKIKQLYYEVKHTERVEALTRLIDVEDGGRFLIFCHTKREVDFVAMVLHNRGYSSEAMHGDYSQSQRESVLSKFKTGEIDILVATDVAARGLDISDISHVVNYAIPQDPETYVHRIGRTGRAGKEGIAITLVTPRETLLLRDIKKLARAEITRGKIPTKAELLEGRLSGVRAKIQSAIGGNDFEAYFKMAEILLEDDIEPIEAFAAMIKLQMEAEDKEKQEEDKKRPAPVRPPQKKRYDDKGGGGGRGGGGGYKGGGGGGGYKGKPGRPKR